MLTSTKYPFTKFAIVLVITIAIWQHFAKPEANYSEEVARDFIEQVPNPDSIHWETDPNHFSWQAGYIMFAMEKMWHNTGDSVYFNYIKRYVDQQVDEKGHVPDFENDALDNFLPGYAILFMYEETGLEKYKTAATHIRNGFDDYPRAPNGLFIHAISDWSKEQVWVDGVFMGQIFLARYGQVIGDRDYAFDEVVKQMTLITNKCQKSNGLLLHGWDPTKEAGWADPETGLSPEVWSEGLGWFAVLIADVFEYLPQDQPGRDRLMETLKKLCYGLKETQDPETGMWCQVVDKCDQPGNWNETSGTGMFLYLLKSSMENGYIPEEEFAPVVENAYNGIIEKAEINEDGHIDLIDCSSIGVQENFEAYISQEKEVSPFAAFGSFIIGTSAMEF
ncbi:MAG: glycoside hydrolase family 88 protein [Marinilabilia sp.]